MQIKTTMRYHFTWTRMAIIKNFLIKKILLKIITSVGEDLKNLEPSYIAGGNVKW